MGVLEAGQQAPLAAEAVVGTAVLAPPLSTDHTLTPLTHETLLLQALVAMGGGGGGARGGGGPSEGRDRGLM